MKIEDYDYVWNCVRAGLRPWQCLCCNGRKVSRDEHWVKKGEEQEKDREEVKGKLNKIKKYAYACRESTREREREREREEKDLVIAKENVAHPALILSFEIVVMVFVLN
jgi:hypothetical protein